MTRLYLKTGIPQQRFMFHKHFPIYLSKKKGFKSYLIYFFPGRLKERSVWQLSETFLSYDQAVVLECSSSHVLEMDGVEVFSVCV